MDKSMSRLINVIEKTKDSSNCQKVLNLDCYSYFLCLIHVIEEAFLNYQKGTNYSHLIKTSEYAIISYKKLSASNKIKVKKYVEKLRKYYHTLKSKLDTYTKKFFETAYLNLGILLISKDKKEELDDKFTKEDNDFLYSLIHETIFTFQNLEYLDKIIEKNPEILNCYQEDTLVFEEVVSEYISQVKNGNEKLIFYYRLVIYKFLQEKEFDLSIKKQDEIGKMLFRFLMKHSELTSIKAKEIKTIIESIKCRNHAYHLLNINPKEALLTEDEKTNLNKELKRLKNREIINEHIITIDDSDSMVLDDALSITKLSNGNILVKVHISDPLSVISYDSRIIDEAKKRTSTIYDDEHSIHMIDTYVAADKLSLVKDYLRPAKTFSFEFDNTGSVVNFYFSNTMIKVSDRLSYDTLNDLHKNGGNSIQIDKDLENYDKILIYLKRMFSHAKVYANLKDASGIKTKVYQSFSENLVSYLMLLTGHMVSKYFSDNNLPYVYRCHEFNKEWLHFLDLYIENPNNLKYSKMLKNIKGVFPKAYYSGINHGHMGLDLDSYSHVTSPLRRYSDILNMHALDLCYFKNSTDEEIYDLEEEIKKVSEYMNMHGNAIDDYMKCKPKIKELDK